MKKLLLLLCLAPLALSSCSGGSEPDKTEPPSTKEIVDKYTDTLVTAPDMAREAARGVEDKFKAIEDQLKEE